MAWETRRNGRSYYYTKRRVGTRVVSEYVGCGMAATFIEESIAESRAASETLRQLREEMAEAEREAKDQAALVMTTVEKLLEKDGYYKHRGEWRKRRRGKNVD